MISIHRVQMGEPVRYTPSLYVKLTISGDEWEMVSSIDYHSGTIINYWLNNLGV